MRRSGPGARVIPETKIREESTGTGGSAVIIFISDLEIESFEEMEPIKSTGDFAAENDLIRKPDSSTLVGHVLGCVFFLLLVDGPLPLLLSVLSSIMMPWNSGAVALGT